MTTIYDDCSKEELLQIVSEMQKDLNDSKKENKELQRIINDLQSDLVGATKTTINRQLRQKVRENNDKRRMESYQR